MQEYDNKNKGTLFKNDKGGNEARPDYTGNMDVEGKQYRLAAWIKVSQKTGNKFLSINVQPREEPQATEEPAKADEPVDEAIPF